MNKDKQLHFPKMSKRAHVRALRESMDNARPYSTTFLFMDGCNITGEQAKAIEKVLEANFKRWADTWIYPHIEDLEKKLAK